MGTGSHKEMTVFRTVIPAWFLRKSRPEELADHRVAGFRLKDCRNDEIGPVALIILWAT
jgi:hypothetical protein